MTEIVALPDSETASPTPPLPPTPAILREIPPSMPALLAPSLGDTVTTPAPLFTWTPHPRATHYRLIVRRVGAKTARINLRVRADRVCGGEICILDTALRPQLKKLAEGRNFQWRVVALRGERRLSASRWGRFTVAPRNICPGPGPEGCVSPPPSSTPVRTATPRPTSTHTPRPPATATRTFTRTATRTATRTPTRTATRTPSPTGGVCTFNTPAPTRTPCPFGFNCPVAPTPSGNDLRGNVDSPACVRATPTRTAPPPTPTRTNTSIPLCIVEVPITATLDVRVRSDNSELSTRIGQLYPGQRIQVSAQENGWYQLFANNVSHWVRQDLVNTVSGNCAALPGRLSAAPSNPLNDDVYCFDALRPGSGGTDYTYCENTVLAKGKPVYDGLIARLGKQPSIREVLAITVELEWWTNRSRRDGLVKAYGTEGIARAYYENCGTDGCNTRLELVWFLTSYQGWLLVAAGADADPAVNALIEKYNEVLPQIGDPNSEYSQVINSMLNPTDPSWRDGKVDIEPWQWFNCNSSRTRSSEGINATNQVLLRVNAITFEMYTAAQTDTLNRAVECQ